MTLFYITYKQDPWFRFKLQPKINIIGPIINIIGPIINIIGPIINIIGPIIKQIQLINIYNFVN